MLVVGLDGEYPSLVVGDVVGLAGLLCSGGLLAVLGLNRRNSFAAAAELARRMAPVAALVAIAVDLRAIALLAGVIGVVLAVLLAVVLAVLT